MSHRIAAVFLFLTLCSVIHAQDQAPGNKEGRFFGRVFTVEPPIPPAEFTEADTDQDEAIALPPPGVSTPPPMPIAGAEVLLKATDGRTASYTATTNEKGRFRIKDVEPGDYRVRVTAPGFVKTRLKVTIARKAKDAKDDDPAIDQGGDDFGTPIAMPRKRVFKGRLVAEVVDPAPPAPKNPADPPVKDGPTAALAAVQAGPPPTAQLAPVTGNTTLTLAPPPPTLAPIQGPGGIINDPGPTPPPPPPPPTDPAGGSATIEGPGTTGNAAGGAVTRYVQIEGATVQLEGLDRDDVDDKGARPAPEQRTETTKKRGRFKFRELESTSYTLTLTLPATATDKDGKPFALADYPAPAAEVVQLSGPITFRRIVLKKKVFGANQVGGGALGGAEVAPAGKGSGATDAGPDLGK